jgi:hypothetical protein
MPIKYNKVIIPNDYTEKILDVSSGDSFNQTNSSVTVDLSSLENLSPKMSYVAEVYYKCNESNYTPVTLITDDDFLKYNITFEIILDKNTVSKYRFFRFYLTPNVSIKNMNDEGKSMRVYMDLKFIIDSETIFTTTFQRLLSKNEVQLDYHLLLKNTEFTFTFDSLNGTITDEAPDKFGTIMKIFI